jgi:hypothetical protein
MTRDELVKMFDSRAISYKLVGDGVRVLDMTQLPAEMRSQFNANGEFIGSGEAVVETEKVSIEPGVVVEAPVVEAEGVTFDPASAANEAAREDEDETAVTAEAKPSDEDEGESGHTAALRGPLPEGFPGRVALDEAGHGTYAKARKLIAKGEGWWKDVAGVGEVTAGHIEDALKESE